jgi:hypothetical protein
VPRVRRSRGGPRFGAKVAGASVLAFLAVFYSDHIPAAAQGVISFSRNLGRENAPPTGAYYSGCDEARAAGVAPLYVNEPGYRAGMDGDGDGVACEPYR